MLPFYTMKEDNLENRARMYSTSLIESPGNSFLVTDLHSNDSSDKTK